MKRKHVCLIARANHRCNNLLS